MRWAARTASLLKLDRPRTYEVGSTVPDLALAVPKVLGMILLQLASLHKDRALQIVGVIVSTSLAAVKLIMRKY